MYRSASLTEICRKASKQHSYQYACALARLLANDASRQLTTFCVGELGAGKTTWVRWILQELGVTETIKSPSFSLAHSYTLGSKAGARCGQTAWHLDLYRMQSPAEWAQAGLNEIFEDRGVVFIEWPERALLNKPDMTLILQTTLDQEDTRVLTLRAHNETVARWLQHFPAQ